MSTHINAANKSDIAESILVPGDPLRAKFIAENFLDSPKCYNEIRGMLGYTGTYKGKRISVMGTGMGMPSMGIYSHELIHVYGVKNLIRIGSCGAIRGDILLGDIIMAQASCTDSNYAHQYQLPGTFSAIADFGLLSTAKEAADRLHAVSHVGNVLSSDLFYTETPEWKSWAELGVLGIEMESYALYCEAARAGVKALGIFTVSDSIVNEESLSAKERQNGFRQMMEIALETAVCQ